MKTLMKGIVIVLIACLVSVLFAETRKGIVVDSYIGTVQYRVGKAGWKKAAVGDLIPETAEIRVRKTGDSADFLLPNGTIVKIPGGTLRKKVTDIISESRKTTTVAANVPADVETVTGVASVRGNVTVSQNVLTVGVTVGSSDFRIGEGDWIPLKTGDKIPENSEVRVNGKNDSLELILPDQSSLDLYGLTSVRVVEILKPRESKRASLLSILTGKLFAKIKPAADQDFRIETQTAVASVRGTKFGIFFIPGKGGEVVVTEGTIALDDPFGKFQQMLVQSGFMSTLSGIIGNSPGAPVAAPLQLLQQYDTNYKPEGSKSEPAPEPSPQPAPGVTEPSPAPTPSQSKATECSEQGFNWSVAGENIDGILWNKVLLSPTFKFGAFSFALYIPVYFQNLDDLFVPVRWYNYDEWNFASWDDAIHDLLLKIRFIQFQNETVLVKFGNIPDMTIGHGSLVDGYANDLQFPAERRVGIQLNLDFGRFGFESMVGDLFLTKLFAGRLFVRPLYGAPVIGNLGVGVSGFIDVDPLYDGAAKAFGYAADLDLPVAKLPMFALTLYSDVATLGYADTNRMTNEMMKDLGIYAGVRGTLIVIDYKAEYRRIQDGFIPGYVNKFYDATGRVANFTALSYGTAANFNGFLVSAGKTFEGVGGVSLSYQHYLPDVADTNTYNFFHMEAGISKCLFKKAYGLIAYDRQNFAFGDLFTNFLGSGAVITTQIFYEIAAGAYIGLTVKKYYDTDASGRTVEKMTYGLTTEIGL